MRLIKMIGLAAMAAMGLMAFLGAGTASATVLCTTTDTPSCTMSYGVGTAMDISLKSGTSLILREASGPPVSTCTGSTVKGQISNAGGPSATVVTGIEEWTWTGCDHTTHTVKKGSLEFHYITSTHNATVTYKEFEFTVVLASITCSYTAGTGAHFGTLTSGETPVIDTSTEAHKSGGVFVCPTAVWIEAEYTMTEPHALYVTAS